MEKYSGKRVVITGAGSGVGRAMALQFAEMGWRIGLADINAAGAEKSLEMVKQAGGTGEVYPVDVTDHRSVKEMADHFFNAWGGVDILVNNAGIAVAGHIGNVSLERWEKVVDVNFFGMLYGCHAFMPKMKAQGGGHILNVASAAGFLSLASMGPYNVSKAAVISLSETLRVEAAPYNVGVTVACPTFFKTGLLDDAISDEPWILELAETAFREGHPADKIAQKIIRSVFNNKLYCVPMFFGKLLWLHKRLTPNFYYDLPAWLNKRGWMEPLYSMLARRGILSR